MIDSIMTKTVVPSDAAQRMAVALILHESQKERLIECLSQSSALEFTFCRISKPEPSGWSEVLFDVAVDEGRELVAVRNTITHALDAAKVICPSLRVLYVEPCNVDAQIPESASSMETLVAPPFSRKAATRLVLRKKWSGI